MQFPSLSRRQKYAVNIPKLNGGLNAAESLNSVNDNQLTDVGNMWWNNGALRTRPGISKADESKSGYTESLYNEITVTMADPVRFNDGKMYKFIISKSLDFETEVGGLIIKKADVDGAVTDVATIGFSETDYPSNVLLFCGNPTLGSGVYLFCNMKLWDGTENGMTIWELNTAGDTFTQITDSYIYAPIVYVNGKGNEYSTLPTADTATYAPASLFEGFNLLSGKFRAFFTTDGVSYKFTVPVKELVGEIKANYLTSSGTTRAFTIPSGSNISNKIVTSQSGFTGDYTMQRIYCTSDRLKGEISFALEDVAVSGGIEELITVITYDLPRTGNTPNNLEIISSAPTNLEQINKVSNMEFSSWFGGSAGGIGGGSRLFLGGNNGEKNLVVWSDLNNPLYFPENNYAYIGDSAQAVTAFSKQSDMLVLFKEHETYFTTYIAGSSYTADDVISGRVIDVTATAAIFPITQIHSSIGCDCPKTIQLCQNRLVWACEDKKVYTLVSANQYSKNNIFPISMSIDRILLLEDFTSPYSFLYGGYYFLCFGGKAYALDYDDASFYAVTAYKDSDKANKTINWYIWNLPQHGVQDFEYISAFSDGVKCCLVTSYDFLLESGSAAEKTIVTFLFENTSFDEVLNFSLNEITETYDYFTTETDINCFFQTKVFDFGSFSQFKDISQIYMGIGSSGNYSEIMYLTDNGVFPGGSVGIESEASDYTSQYINTVRLLPDAHRVIRFGVRFACKGSVSFDSMIIKYSYLGGVR